MYALNILELLEIGIIDDTIPLQKAIDYANKYNKKVQLLNKTYLITNSIVLNGCSLEGVIGNIFKETGSVIKCATNNFIAIKQGELTTDKIMFTLKNILVINANIGYEINYAINSKFENLYASNCDIGFKLGDKNAVGSMFCEFNNLYTSDCRVGIESYSKEYFNNNRFNNGFIAGEEYAMKLQVDGGYGAVDNVFNNVEFRSLKGRGILLTSTWNTIFNSCYFECGGNAVRMTNTNKIALNENIYGSFKILNTNGDENIIYTEGGGNITINDGIVYLTQEHENIYFYNSGNPATHQNIRVTRAIQKNGTATGFNFFSQNVKEVQYTTEESVTLTGTVTLEPGVYTEVPFTYAKEFSTIPNVTLPVIRGANGIVKNVTYLVSERLKTGGKLSVYNGNSSAVSVSFSIYSKIV